MRYRQPAADSPEIPMAPLIDAVFLLLIFFLVATMFRKQEKDIDITPPESTSAMRVLPDDAVVAIGIDEQGKVYWQGETTSRTLLHERLRALAEEDPTRQIRLDADHRTPFRNVAEVLDIIRFRGMSNVGIRTYDDRYGR